MLPLNSAKTCRSIRTFFLPGAVCLLLIGMGGTAWAQPADDDKIPEPEDITLETKDLVQLKCTWYAGVNGKKTVPIIIVHGWEGNRNQFDSLALFLQSKEGGGHAVIVPDLRGHGASTSRKLPNGEEVPLDRERFRPQDFAAMVQFDLEAVKSHLMKQNNEGKLNIEALTIVGSEFGSLVALGFAVQDWSWPQLATIKQGQDVKALVLISPEKTFKGMTATKALQHPVVRAHLSILIVAGRQDRSGYSDAKTIYTQLKRYHPDPPPAEVRDKKDLFLGEPDTSLRGDKLITAPGLNVAGMIRSFIELRLVNKDIDWTDRTSPFASQN